jgi:hypothetical protein
VHCKILKELPIIGINYLTQLFSAVLLKGYFQAQWKIARVILILKPRISPNELTPYQPINLLLIVSKVCEKLLLNKFLEMVDNNGFIPHHQFIFSERDSTIEQTHQIVQSINEALENKQYCSAAFLDISQTFDQIWHTGILSKLRQFLPLNYLILLKSCRHSRHFLMKFESVYTELSSVKASYPRAVF